MTVQLARQPGPTDLIIGHDCDLPPCLAPGFYEALGGSKWSARNIFKTSKLYVSWTVLVPDADAENGCRRVQLTRHYNVRQTAGRRWRAGSRSDYFREWVLLTQRLPSSREPMSPSVFTNVLCRVEVRTVEIDFRQRSIPEAARYSIVARIVEVLAGGGRR